MTVTVLVVDDHAIVRQGVATMLRSSGVVSVLGEAQTGMSALELSRKLKPQIVLMDLGLPDISGASAIEQILAESAGQTRVIALSAFTGRQHVVSALRAGASGYVVKDSAVDELLDAIQTVAGGGRYLSPAMASLVFEDLVGSETGAAAGHDGLTHREREVLQLLAEGKAMKEAAQVLHISTKTVETHRRSIMQKLQLFSVAELTKHAIREGLVSLD